MENEILRQILDELKGLKIAQLSTNQRLDSLDQRLDRVEQRLDGTDLRLDKMEQRLDGM
ncbi:MAG: hypothetical protein PWR27_1190, partial [Petroclostridium sp.]|nr:hypothetical protein [Petroclostridium sp.]